VVPKKNSLRLDAEFSESAHAWCLMISAAEPASALPDRRQRPRAIDCALHRRIWRGKRYGSVRTPDTAIDVGQNGGRKPQHRPPK
jgi:hypothetical protein